MLNKKNMVFALIGMLLLCASVINVGAQVTDDDVPASDESGTFLSVSPDALIVLDLSGSMDWNPAGGSFKWGSSTSCTPDTTKCADYTYSGTTYCQDGYCSSGTLNGRPDCNVNCSRVAIAKRALFSVLDDDNNGTINDQDSRSLNVRIGYMRFRNGDDTSGDYAKGNNRIITHISDFGKDTGTSYSRTYCGNSTSCTSSSTCSTGECIASASASGGTPLTSSLKEARSYLNAHKGADKAKECRQKFVILLSDGADTYACGGGGGECQDHMYKRRRTTVAAAKQLADAGYRVFVIGFGSAMPGYLKNSLNWAAYYGGTDNPLMENTGNVAAYNIVNNCNADPAVPAACCDMASNSAACFPSGVTGCTNDATTETAVCQGDNTNYFKATLNDPGYLDLSGYAFIAEDSDQLTTALKSALSTISAATYSFTSASVQAVRTVDENFVYEASFSPVEYDSFWKGHLKRYSIQNSGEINATADWDAGEKLFIRGADDRSIYTYIGGSITAFNTTNVTYTHLNVTDSTTAGKIITFVRGGEQSGANQNWKLGDIFHSSPLSIGTPNYLFYDRWDKSEPKAFKLYREENIRTSANGKRIILVGANDGQLHSFQTGESAGTGGRELWSFVPPNFLSRLKLIAHETHPTLLQHEYFVDGPTSAADVWMGGTATAIGETYKTKDQWRTYLVMSEGRGGISTLWSSSSSCDSGFSNAYSSTYPHYCGYYAFDVTSTTNTTPTFKWRLGGNSGLSATAGAHLGQAWSKMFMGRVRIDNKERWVGLIGGGYSGGSLPKGTTAGKGFYVVDLSDGSILWTFTHNGPDHKTNGKLDFDLVAGPVAVDYDNDGFLDTAYIGDLGGNVWRIKFCLQSAGTACGVSAWEGGLLFDSSTGAIRPIFTPVSVSMDKTYKLWVYFGSGDKNDPTAPNSQEKFYAIRDKDRTATYYLNSLENLGDLDSAGVYSGTKDGWYLTLTGEKILAEPVVFEGRVYFTSYEPANANDPCDQAGTAKLSILDYITGAGKATTGGAKTITLEGKGVPSAPIISRNPYGGTDVYVSTSVGKDASGGGSGGGDGKTDKVEDPNIFPFSPNSIIYWHDRRVQ